MNVRAYYNEIDPAAGAVLRELVSRNVIMPGDVDDRSIKDVQPSDLAGYTQCHFFAGGGLWSVAARLAGWPDNRPLWTGSCPCQPFSSAGKGGGTDDPRHLWPDFHRLIRACRPAVVMGEQVAGAAGYGWFDGVRSDLAPEDYACRCVDIPACAVDAPHQRSRLYWIARLEGQRRHGDRGQGWPRAAGSTPAADGELHGYLADNDERSERRHHRIARTSSAEGESDARTANGNAAERPHAPRRNGSFWSDAEWIVSPLDGKARRAKPGVPFLVDGLPGRVDLWRLGGNAIVPILAAEVIAAFIEAEAAE